jgi:hypothetical protein
MDKAHPSRWSRFLVNRFANAVARPCSVHSRLPNIPRFIGQRPMPQPCRFLIVLLIALAAISFALTLSANPLSPAEARRIGQKIWKNECDGTVSGLTSWNSGENFASLGIGHFIWYPEGVNGPFEESFPPLVAFMAERGRPIPAAIRSEHCPWRDRAEFLKAQNSPAMNQLRHFLADTIDLQSQFLVERLNRSLPKMLEEAPATERERIRNNFQQLLTTPQGCYALVDYVNFKGEGVLHSERYQGEGWGLLQVLEQIKPGSSDMPQEFAHAAGTVLRRRVANAPATRNERRWLAGWLKRVNSYNHD